LPNTVDPQDVSPPSNRTLLHDVPDSAAILNCRERWLLMQLRSGRFPGHKVQRQWRMSDDDIAAAVDLCAVTTEQTPSASLADQLTERSRRAHTAGKRGGDAA
jgi:hypothetical protein